jgi:hypothetical protein
MRDTPSEDLSSISIGDAEWSKNKFDALFRFAQSSDALSISNGDA